MNIHIIDGGAELDDKTRAGMELRLGLALGRFSKQIARVTLSVDVDGRQESLGKKCRIEVLLRPTRKIIVEDADADLNTAIDRAASQMARSVARKIRRESDLAS
jgi:ribosome-associated translation inhibitor RaiA